MSLAHRYDELHQSDAQEIEIDARTSDASADAKLEAFETGYQAGWQDATKAHEAEQSHISADFAQNLQDMSFTYQEARSKLISAMEPVLNAMMNKLIPGLLGASVRSHLIEQMQDLLSASAEESIELVVSPSNIDAMNELLSLQPNMPFMLRSEANLGDGQVFIRANASERCIDIDQLSKEISDSLKAFFQQSLEVVKDG